MHRVPRLIAATAWSLLAAACGSGPESTAPPAPSTLLAAPVPPPPETSTFTFSIDPSCRSPFPESLQQRSYQATADSSYAGIIHLTGDFAFSAGTPWNLVYRSSDAGSTTLWFQDPPLWEQLDGQAYFLIYGVSEYRGTSEYGEWPFSGRVTFCAASQPGSFPACAVPEITCQSTGHRLRVARN